LAESQLDLVRFMRAVADGEIMPLEAVRAYHAALEQQGIPAIRRLEDDRVVTEATLKKAASA